MDNPLIPYFKTSRYRVDAMVELAQIKLEDTVVDLGSGDGRIVIAFAKKGISAVGYELENALIRLSKQRIKEQNLEKLAKIEKKDFWKVDLSPYSIVTIYPMPDIMDALEEKLIHELKPGARVLTNYYLFNNWNCTITKDKVYMYAI